MSVSGLKQGGVGVGTKEIQTHLLTLLHPLFMITIITNRLSMEFTGLSA
jgi:hypothetical protein